MSKFVDYLSRLFNLASYKIVRIQGHPLLEVVLRESCETAKCKAMFLRHESDVGTTGLWFYLLFGGRQDFESLEQCLIVSYFPAGGRRIRFTNTSGNNVTQEVKIAARAMWRNDFFIPCPVAASETSLSSLDTTTIHHVNRDNRKFDYDMAVVGGGCCGLAAAKEAAVLGAKVAMFDYVQTTPIGTSWGLGGSCAKVGCIPKKLMHQASLLGEAVEDASKYGWEMAKERKHNWTTLVNNVKDYLSFTHHDYQRAVLRRGSSITYFNSYAKFLDPHKLQSLTARSSEVTITAERFVVATGGRPRYPEIPGAQEYCITSDDIFALPYPPGKTLVVGASCVALECAGFLNGIGYDVTVMVRSILLRGFDQEMAERIGKYMEETKGVKFIRETVPTKVERIEEGQPGRLRVTSNHNGEKIVEEYNTVLLAVGRDAVSVTFGLDKAGVKLNLRTGKLDATAEQTNVKHVYALGDVLCGRPELTPVATQAGIMLARRLYGGSSEVYDYDMIPTTVFTPLEYGAIGYAEEAAIEKYGKENIEVYHTLYRPLEWTLPGHADSSCYAKLVCLKSKDERVIGFHVCGPNAGEITQGYAVGMRLGARKKDFDNTTGIYPTCSEIFTMLTISKSSSNTVSTLTNQETVPNVFVRGQHVGGCDATTKLHEEGRLLPMTNTGSTTTLPSTASTISNGEQPRKFDYDLVVMGGGSGGLAAAKEAAGLGAKVAVFDFVQPTPMGTSWGLGGTCVNVGCIPKKLMHQASLLGEAVEDARKYGWEMAEERKHNWTTMVTNIQEYISSLNWEYKLALRDANVTYHNSYAKFLDHHKVLAVNAKGKEVTLTSERFIVATGGRPRYPEIPGAREYCITSDDIFALPYPPGKTLVVGASCVALECAGFLNGIGYDVTVMVRSILLRGFDQEMAERIGKYMEETKGVKFIRETVPTKVERIEEGQPGRLRVTSDHNGEEIVEEYNTVLLAIGRDASTGTIGLEKAGVKVNSKTGKLDATAEQTNVKHVYAIGDVLCGRPELTPVAIQAGIMLARRLYGGSSEVYDYDMIPTTVFTPLEYGAIGYAEEAAIEKYGKENIEVYHTLYRPLEWTLPGHADSSCYAKLVCLKSKDERVIGFHVCGPNAGEITQGYAVGMRLGARKKDFDNTTGIHPTCSEIFTTLTISKSSGKDISAAAC